MNWLAHSHEIVASLAIGTFVAGLIFLVLGKRARDLDWIVLSILVLFLIGIAIDLFFVDGGLGSQQKIWSRGWIGPRDQNGAITIGIIEDNLGLTAVLCASAVATLFSFSRAIIRREPNSTRVLSSLLMSVAGVTVAWLSLTPWLSILGMSLTTLAGVILYDANPEPDLIARFGSERAWGFILSFLGAAVLAGGRHALTLDSAFSLSAGDFSRVFDWIGGSLLMTGLYLYLHPFPLFGWLSRPPKVSAAASAIVGQLLPALASFALLIRFEPVFRSIGIFGIFGWIALGSAILAAICGLAQPTWKTALPLWISSALTLALTALCFSGGMAAFVILIGVVLSGSALALLASMGEKGTPKRVSGWAKVLAFTLLAPGTGLLGFIGSGGLVRVMSQGAQDPPVATLLCLGLICSNLLLWKTVFALVALQASPAQGGAEGDSGAWLCVASGWVVLALSLGLLWTGTLTGGALPGDPDKIFPSWISEMLGPHAASWAASSALSGGGLGVGLYWAGILLPIPLALWLFGRRQDRVINSLARSPRLRAFLETGYAIDRLGAAMARALRKSGDFMETWISEKISTEWIPHWTGRAISAPARWLSETDRHAYAQEEQLLRRWTEVPAKALQLVQNGDVQWYLFFAIGSIVAILVHFLRYSS